MFYDHDNSEWDRKQVLSDYRGDIEMVHRQLYVFNYYFLLTTILLIGQINFNFVVRKERCCYRKKKETEVNLSLQL